MQVFVATETFGEIVKKNSLLLFVVAACLLSFACNKGSQPSSQASPPSPSAKRYQLKGKVVSIDQQGKVVNIDSEAVPGFMEAMTMPYQVKPESELDKIHPGDAITADLLVQDEKAWLENITVTGHPSSGTQGK